MTRPTPVPEASALPDFPWTNPDCAFCSGKGVDANNDPCGKCRGEYVAAGGPNLTSFTLAYDQDAGEQVARVVYEASCSPSVKAAAGDVAYVGRRLGNKAGSKTDIAFPLIDNQWPSNEAEAAWDTNPFLIDNVEETPAEEPTEEPATTEAPPPARKSGRVPREEALAKKSTRKRRKKKTEEPETENSKNSSEEPTSTNTNECATEATGTETTKKATGSTEATSDTADITRMSTEPKKNSDEADAVTPSTKIFGTGLIVCVGQTISAHNSGRPVVELDSYIPVLMDAVAKAMDQKNYWHCDPFRRRDGLTALAEKLVEDCNGSILMIRDTQSPETRDLVTAICGRAATVFRA